MPDLLKKIRQFLEGKFRANSCIFILLVVAYLFLFFIPGVKTLFIKLKQCRQVKVKVLQTRKDWDNIGSFKEKILQFNQRIDYYEKRLPGEKEIPAILENLSQAANKLNVRITEIKPIEQAEEGETIYYSVPILVTAECGYHALGRFINALEQADRFMKISDIKIVNSLNRNDIHNVQLIVTTYVMKK